MTTGSVLFWYFGLLAALVGLCWVVSFFNSTYPVKHMMNDRNRFGEGQTDWHLALGMSIFLCCLPAWNWGWSFRWKLRPW